MRQRVPLAFSDHTLPCMCLSLPVVTVCPTHHPGNHCTILECKCKAQSVLKVSEQQSMGYELNTWPGYLVWLDTVMI